MKKLIVFVALLLVVAMAAGVYATPAGKNKVFETSMGKVTMSGDAHKAKGVGCMDCHKSIFKMAAGAGKNPAPHKAGESCGSCHDGTKAFAVTADCAKCHVK